MNFSRYIDDALFQVERKIAQRADELLRERGSNGRDARLCWEQAEREYWEGHAGVTDMVLRTAAD